VELPGPLRNYLETAVVSCCVEAPSLAAARVSAEAEVAPIVDPKESAAAGSALTALGIAPALDVVFDGVADEVAKAGASTGKSEDSLVRVDNLMMMYGGGNILLKNSTLDLRRGHRYGVVGRNGAGKTTLMSMIANGGVTQIPSSIKTLHVRPEVLVEASELTATQFCSRDSPGSSEEELEAALQKVGFPKEMQAKSVNELSGGWRMKLLLASAMMRHCDILLLDEPTNHLDKESVAWLSKYLVSLTTSTLMVISHDPYFLNEVCTDIIQYSGQRTLEYYPGNFADFREAKKLSDQDSEALLLGNEVDLGENPDIPADEVDSGLALTAAALDKQAKITFPIPGKLSGHSAAKPVVEMKDVSFAYNEEEGPLILTNVTCKVTLSSRIGIVGANGAGKSTLLNLICGELTPSPGPDGAQRGEVARHRNLRLAYIAQQHMYHLSEFMNSTPYIYIQRRFKEGFDEALQRRLIDPANEEEAKLRAERAKRWGKYGNEVQTVIGRIVKGNDVMYEVQWKGLDDPKQNTWETVAKLKNLGVVSVARAYDERQAAMAAGNDQRPLSQKEIVKHLESFGLNEDQVLNQHIGSFSAGQKSKLTLGAAFWTKPHVVALDEPTNYIDMETLDALAKALQRFKGGMVVISHSSDFVDRVCTEQWLVEGNTIAKVTKCEVKK
jgi:ATPase subunit of ABC transporter with duplicated ATPase domains